MSAVTKMVALFDSIKHARVFSGTINENSKHLLSAHDGSFHCDEAMALSFLKILPHYRDSEIPNYSLNITSMTMLKRYTLPRYSVM